MDSISAGLRFLQPGDFRRIAKAVQDDVGAFSGQAARDPQADAGGRAGDERGFAAQ
jgi:hypothetical protein